MANLKCLTCGHVEKDHYDVHTGGPGPCSSGHPANGVTYSSMDWCTCKWFASPIKKQSSMDKIMFTVGWICVGLMGLCVLAALIFVTNSIGTNQGWW